MSNAPEIELKREAFRQVFTGPLAKPLHLKVMLFGFLAASVLGAFAAWQLGGFWAALLPIPCAVMAGVAWAGHEPGYWFRNPPRDN